MNDSILTSVKISIGITESDTSFDESLVHIINAIFSILTQLGAGPDTGFSISDKTAVWSSYMNECPALEMVKEYVMLKADLMFDHSTKTGPVIEVCNRILAELESRILYETDR